MDNLTILQRMEMTASAYEWNLFGGFASFLNLCFDKEESTGEYIYNKDKTNSFIDELMKMLDCYLESARGFGLLGTGDREEAYYRAFFYLTIRLSTMQRTYRDEDCTRVGHFNSYAEDSVMQLTRDEFLSRYAYLRWHKSPLCHIPKMLGTIDTYLYLVNRSGFYLGDDKKYIERSKNYVMSCEEGVEQDELESFEASERQAYEYLMQFQSKYDTEIYIGTANSRLKAVRGKNNARDFHYQTDDGEMWWRNGNDMGWFTADIANNSCRARFVKTQKAQWKESGSLKLTNKYEPHAGLELVKVDENGASNQWTDEAVFTLYHMRGQIAPVTLSLSDGKHLIEEVPTSLIPEAGKTSYFFIVETIRPKQGNKEYAQLGTAIPISINSRGEVALITEASQYPTDNFFHTNYNATTKILAAAGSGTNARPAIKVDFSQIGTFDQIGTDKTVTYSTDDKRLVITAKNNPISNELELLKIDSSTEAKPLDGADFTIVDANNNYVQNATSIYWTTVDAGFKVSNLAPGTYTITEFNAPTNYVKSNATVTVVVDDYGNITVTPSDTNVVVVGTDNGTTSVRFQFKNEISSYELPEAGGIGTTILYITGAILVLGAGVLLIVRKKMNK